MLYCVVLHTWLMFHTNFWVRNLLSSEFVDGGPWALQLPPANEGVVAYTFQTQDSAQSN